ncbi:MAG: leucyl aminopeptidase [bacterium]
MRWTVTSTHPGTAPGDLLVYPVFRKDQAADLRPLLADLGGGKAKRGGGRPDLKAVVARAGFTAKAESTLAVHCEDLKAGWVLLVGMGPVAEVGLEGIRKAAGAAAKQGRSMDAARILVAVPGAGDINFDDQTFGRSWAEGAELALSPVGELKTGPRSAPKPTSWSLIAGTGRHRDLRAGLAEARALTAGTLFARRLVNLPPNHLTPADLAAHARRLARAEGMSCRVLGVPELKKLKMGGILGVGQGSANPPRLIVLEYKGSRRKNALRIALVGKGVTFDSGGISLKPGQGMEEMKCDMAGAAGVMGAALTIARLKLPVNLQVVVPAAENMPDGRAVKPADVITMASGKTVEVLNTDAEGRLILADALWYAGRSKPDHVIDMATLTGACVVALGKHFAGMLGNSGELMDAIKQAGGETFERVWPLPLVDEHKEMMKGTWSDLQNLGGGREGGALTAAAFLAAFVDDKTSWSHLDIAGPAYSTSDSATSPKGGTGFGARLLARTVQILVG